MTEASSKSEAVPSVVFKWSDEDTERLILWRSKNEFLFTGKRNAALKGFENFILESGLQGKVTAGWAKKKWENLKQKYKDLKCPQSGVSTEGGEATAASWKWYEVMDAVLGNKPSITPPVLIQSGAQDAVVDSSPSGAGPSLSEGGGRKRKRKSEKGPEILQYLRELEERENRREAEAQEREEECFRQLEVRERQREEEARRREGEARRREEEARRREEEARRREEEARRREEEFRARMEDRDQQARREAATREERFLTLMEALLNKK